MSVNPNEIPSGTRVEDFLDPTPETLAALGGALHGLQSLAEEEHDMTVRGVEGFVRTSVDQTFQNGTVIHGSWVDGGESRSVADLPPEFPITYVDVDTRGDKLRYTLCANGQAILSIFQSHVPTLPGTTNKSPTEGGVLRLTSAISSAVASGLSKDSQQD